MKKITLLLCLLVMSLGYSQTDVIENFDGTAPTLEPDNGDCSPNFIGMNIGTTQSQDANSLELIAQAAGNPWQGAQVIPQGISGMDLTTNLNMTVEVYSDVAAGILAKVTGGTGPDSATAANHTGSGWETLSFDFSVGADGTTAANGVYPTIRFYPLWGTSGGYAGQGSAACVSDAPITIYIDDIIGTLATGATCNDGMMNGNETGVDCGGPDCPSCPPPSAAPTPTDPDSDVLVIYGDTGGYSNFWIPDYPFGTNAGEVDLDSGAGVNNARLFTLNVAGYGEGTNVVTDISGATSVKFDYWADANSTSFYLDLIEDDGGAQEYFYTIADAGGDGTIVTGAWTSVEIPMTFFTAQGFSLDKFFQWKIDATSDLLSESVYVDNLRIVGPSLSNNEFETVEFKVYPNPTNGDWNMSSSNTINTVEVYDILGKQVLSLSPNSNEIAIDATSLKTGIYFARIEGANGSKTIKLVRE